MTTITQDLLVHADPLASARPASFCASERARLLTTPGLGPLAIQRLEDAGYTTLSLIRQIGVDTVVRRICDEMGQIAWANRRRALRRALQDCAGASAGKLQP